MSPQRRLDVQGSFLNWSATKMTKRRKVNLSPTCQLNERSLRYKFTISKYLVKGDQNFLQRLLHGSTALKLSLAQKCNFAADQNSERAFPRLTAGIGPKCK